MPTDLAAVSGLLVLPGLAALYRLLEGRRAWWWCYLAGAVHMGVFSWSLRHLLFAAWLGIALVGGGYFAVLPLWVRGLAGWRLPRPLAFGLAVAGASWLRAFMPEISYPHAQPSHALYLWPRLLSGPVGLGGEPLANLLLATFAAAVYEASRARGRGLRGLLAVGLAWAACAAIAAWSSVGPAARASRPGGQVEVAAVQPGPIPWTSLADFAAWQEQRLLEPTRALGRDDAPPPLVLWPESASFVDVEPGTGGGPARAVLADEWRVRAPLPLARATRLLLGGRLVGGPHHGVAAAILLDGSGSLLGYQQKVRLVPGGERQPFLGWLPDSWSTALQRGLAQAIGAAPHLEPAPPRPPLVLDERVTVGALLCYDNAYADVARGYVEAGANLLVVLSNEMWYQGGAELEQMVAMSVFRALETGVPVLRCTIDGETVLVGPDGRIGPRLARTVPGVLRLSVDVPGGTGPVAPAAPVVALVCALSLVFGIAHALAAWVRLRQPFAGDRSPGGG
ncbi:MAG: apolipoprotein N-acyltransferase [Planctomycetota bacterium]